MKLTSFISSDGGLKGGIGEECHSKLDEWLLALPQLSSCSCAEGENFTLPAKTRGVEAYRWIWVESEMLFLVSQTFWSVGGWECWHLVAERSWPLFDGRGKNLGCTWYLKCCCAFPIFDICFSALFADVAWIQNWWRTWNNHMKSFGKNIICP